MNEKSGKSAPIAALPTAPPLIFSTQSSFPPQILSPPAYPAYQEFKARTGIDIYQASIKNYQDLRARLQGLNSVMATSIKQYLADLPRNQQGLTISEQYLVESLLAGDWHLAHRTSTTEIETILAKDRPELLSTQDLFDQGLEPYTNSGYIDEIFGGIFFNIFPGEVYGYTFDTSDASVEIRVNLKEVPAQLLAGLFASSCMHSFRSKAKKNNPVIIHNTLFYTSTQEGYDSTLGVKLERNYHFIQPDSTIVVETTDRSQGIFTQDIMLQALCYTVVERIRQLGKQAWQEIYSNIKDTPLVAIQELARSLLHHCIVEAHLPRSLILKAPGISIIHHSPQQGEQHQKMIDEAYKGNLSFIEELSLQDLHQARGQLGDESIDILAASILGGHLQLALQVLSKRTTLDAHSFLLVLAAILEFKMPPRFSYNKKTDKWVESPRFSSIMLCPGSSKTEREDMVWRLLTKATEGGVKSYMNPHIYWPFSFESTTLSFISNELDEELPAGTAKQKFKEFLIRKGCSSYGGKEFPHKAVFIFEYFDAICQQDYYLLEHGKAGRNFMYCLRPHRKLLEPLDVDLSKQYFSDPKIVEKVASGYFAIVPRAIHLIQKTITGNTTIFHIKIVDNQTWLRLIGDFSHFIVSKAELKDALKASVSQEKLHKNSDGSDQLFEIRPALFISRKSLQILEPFITCSKISQTDQDAGTYAEPPIVSLEKNRMSIRPKL